VRIVIVDDEYMALENLKYVMKHFECLEIVGMYTDPIEAIQNIAILKPDAVFLDIEMPGVNGFTVAEEIIEVLPGICIVFVTGFDEYAVKAFEINAIDYILKPVSGKRLEITIEKLLKNLSDSRNREDNPIIESNRKISALFRKKINKVIAWKENKIILLDPEQILYFTALAGKIVVITNQGEFEVRNSLNYWEERMSCNNFFRCHRSFLINMDKIEMIRPMFGNTYDIKLTGCSQYIPVSRKYARQLKCMLE